MAAGTVLPSAPAMPPGTLQWPVRDPLPEARERYREGDLWGALTVLEPWLESQQGPYGRPRTAGHMLLGVVHAELGHYNLASAEFTKVRLSAEPLAPWGAWYEASMDARRARYAVAAAECSAYRTTWPEGDRADDCLLLMGESYAATGAKAASLAAFQSFLELNPDSPRREEVRLGIALALEQTSPSEALPLLKDLVLSHNYASSEREASEALRRLKAQGYDTTLADGPTERMLRADSLRRTGQYDEAWALFTSIATSSQEDKGVLQWVDDNFERFSWGTRNFTEFASQLQAAYDQKPDADTAWRIFEAYTRAGDWKRAAEVGRAGLTKHGNTPTWKNAGPDVAWAETLSGDYATASTHWEALSVGTGHVPRAANFYTAFGAWLGHDDARAEIWFQNTLDRAPEWAAAAHYWRARLRAAGGNATGAAEDRDAIAGVDETGWYTLLLQGNPTGHDGKWRDGPLPAIEPHLRPEAHPLHADMNVSPLETPSGNPGWGSVRWGAPPSAGDAPPAPPALEDVATKRWTDRIDASIWYDPVKAEDEFRRFADSVATIWPDLPAAHDLALAGLYGDSGTLTYRAYEELKAAKLGHGLRVAELSSIPVDVASWRPRFLFAHDDYHASRACYGMWEQTTDSGAADAARRLAFPTVHARYIRDEARLRGLDPFLLLALIRQESTYGTGVRSRAGAVGLMQMLPSTGAKMAGLLGDSRYSPERLEDPPTNIRFGAAYLSLLLQRFDGVFPLAVAAYNAGPHNVSRFYAPLRAQQPDLDVLVELIPWRETRDYVKHVTGFYADYVQLYDAEEPRIAVPTKPKGDHPEVVDF